MITLQPRIPYQTTIISYMPHPIRGEQINFGVVVCQANLQICQTALLPPTTKKGIYLFDTIDEHQLFVETLKLLTCKLKHMTNLDELKAVIKSLRLVTMSPLHPYMTSNFDQILPTLIKTYLGTTCPVIKIQNTKNNELN